MKKIMSAVLALVMLFSVFAGGTTAWATGVQGNVTEAPTAPEGTVFTGWFADEACTTPYTESTGTAYARFTDEKVFGVKYQIKNGANEDDDDFIYLRVISTVDALDYQEVGFHVTFNNEDKGDKATTKVYTSLTAYSADLGAFEAEPTVFSDESQYFFVYNCKINKSAYGKEFTFTPYFIMADGTRVDRAEQEREFTVYEDEYFNVKLISNAEELTAFAEASQSKSYERWKIKLTADIDLNEGWTASATAPDQAWTPIGTTSTPFAGTFDGQGHTIRGVYVNASTGNQGLFKATDATAEIKDFLLKNSYIGITSGSADNMGSIVGLAKGTFEKIYSNAIVTSAAQRVGGLIGKTDGSVTMNDCWFAGSATITASKSYIGGLIGDIAASGTVTINNCLNTAPVRLQGAPGTTGVGGFIGHMASATVNITNSVNSGEPYQGKVNSQLGDLIGYKQSGTLNLSNSHSILYKNNSSSNLYLVGGTSSDPSDCGRFTTDEAKGLSGYKTYAKIRALFDGTKESAAGHWVVTEDTLPVLSLFAEEYSTSRTLGLDWYGDGTATTFTLRDAHQLLGFAAMAQTMNFAGKTVQLGADIDLNEGWTASSTAPATAWTPIGNTTTRFNGTFDGQGHTISGVYLNATTAYQGLFGGTDSGAVIRDFKLKNSYFTSSGQQLGSIVGNAGGTFEKIYSEAIVYGKANYVGGLIGINGSGKAVTMTDCVFAGSATMNAAASFLGGLTGGVQSGGFTINNCLNTGEVAHKYTGTLTTAGSGGFVGTAQAAVTITNSANHTNPSYQKGSGNGLFVGSGSGAVTLTNCHAVDPYSKALVNGQSNSTYTTCTRQAVATVAGLKSLLAANVQNLFASTAKGHWVCSADSLPVLSYFADEYSTFSFDTDWYEVGADTFTLTDAADLYGFAAVSQLTNFAGKTVQLGADIDLNPGCVASASGMTGTPAQWTPIGSIGVRFNGIFDGQGHTIRGVYLNNANQYQGLFVATDSDAVIRNFKLKNSYLSTTNTNLGSIVGYAGGTFEKIYSEAVVYGQNHYVGGLAGANGYGKNLAMTDCWFAGSVTMNAAKYALGGLIGLSQAGATTIANCLNTGEVHHKVKTTSAVYTGGFVGQVSGASASLSISGSVNHTNAAYEGGTGNGLFVGSSGSITLANCHAINCGNKALVSGQSNSTYDTCTSPSKADVAGLKSLTAALVQNLFLASDAQGHWDCSTDSLPVLSYFADEYSNGTIPVNAGWYDEEETDFTLTTAAEFYVFAILSQTNNFAGKTVKLGADIDLNPGCVASTTGMTGSPAAWTPIGSTTNRFAGTFDGQGYTIRGVYLNATADYQGLFGGTDSGAVIRNFKLKNSYLTTTGQHLGSIVGSAAGSFEKIYSEAVVYGQNNYVGGLIGSNGSGKAVTMTDCWFAGSATMNESGKGRLGGLIGLVVSGGATIDNCLNTGEVAHKTTHTKDNVGGFVGEVQSSYIVLSISNSVNHTNPTYTAGSTGHNGLFVGYNAGTVNLTNCHALNCGKHLVYGVNDDTTVYPTCSRQNLVDVVGLKSVSAEKIAYLFTADSAQGHWVCSTDSFPVLSCFADEYSDTIAVDLAANETDATTLSNLYIGRTLYQGELHNHADTSVNSTDGTSDGYVEVTVWYDQMGTLGLDFANSLDHQQTSHIDSANWDKSKLVYGTEAGTWVPSTVSGSTQLHYSMLFRTKAQLEQVLNAFEEFNYGGSNGNPGWTKSRDGRTNNGSAEFTYPNFTRERFAELMEAVQDAGGFFVLPHPFTLSGDTQKVSADYDFGVDGIGFEVKLTAGNHEWDNRMYTGWEELLASGAKIYACAGNDNHTNLDNTSLTSIYGTSDAVSDKGYLVDQLRAGDFVAGSAGIKMCVGNTAMGGSCSFSGQRVVIDVEKIHTIANDLSHQYRLDVISDEGVVCRKELTVDSTTGMVSGTELAFDADASCAFYRVVVVDITAGNSRIAIGNPIWNSNIA